MATKDALAGMAENKQPEQVKVKITRKAGHRHAGVKYPQGADIDVSPADAKIIVQTLKVGELVGGK
ncbi:MAG: hypothetical protein Q7J46_14255 [Pseudomonas sp.]|nr:hypothetical protein [Pseudomonas sp.]